MPALKYLYPESPLSENAEPEKPLTSVTNRESAKDVYGKPSVNTGESQPFGTGLIQDKLALGSELDPSVHENPIAGGFYETGPIHCDTCGKGVSGAEMSLPTHLGHNTRYGDSQPIDVDQVHKTGGDYRIEPSYSSEPSNPSGMSDGVTKPQLKAQSGDTESKSGYSWCPKPIETNDWQNIQPDDAMVNPQDSKLINENTVLLDDKDRTVPM